jgi:alkylation response protein AidB-like acyl-CoA dehydrogenase
MDFDESPEETALRAEAFAWLSSHAKLRDQTNAGPAPVGEVDADLELQHVRASQAWQRTLFEAGWAGITWPRE